MITNIVFLAVCFLAYANGANDNFKGVASLFGSRTCGDRAVIAWATVTLLGMGLATRQVKWKPVFGVLASWVITLPCAAVRYEAARPCGISQ